MKPLGTLKGDYLYAISIVILLNFPMITSTIAKFFREITLEVFHQKGYEILPMFEDLFVHFIIICDR